MKGQKQTRTRLHTLLITYDPAKSSDGGIVAFYDGEPIYDGVVQMWNYEDELDIFSHFDRIRDAWMDLDDDDTDATTIYLVYERPQNGAHFARAAIAEAAGAAFPAFCMILGGKKKHISVVQPRDWHNDIPGMKGNLTTEELKAISLRFAKKTYGYTGDNDNVADAYCIGHHILEFEKRKLVAFESAKKVA